MTSTLVTGIGARVKNAMTRHVLVIGGGQNAEHGSSLKSAAAVGEALRSGGFEVSARLPVVPAGGAPR